ncbi:MAG: GWxTD domain-containing protein [Longimicrobiales bacterium]
MRSGLDRGQRGWLPFAVAACLATSAAPAAAQEALTLHAYRFWRPPDITLIEAYASIPLGLLTFERVGSNERAMFNATLRVLDEDGLALTTQQWSDTAVVPALAESRLRASTTEHFTFQVKPGTYRIELSVEDAKGGGTWRAQHQVQAYAEQPRSSDLVLAGELVRLQEGERGANAIVRGDLAVLPNLAGVLSTQRPQLALYTEVYRVGAESPDSAEVWIELTGVTRSFQYRTPPQRRVYPAGLGSEAYAMDVAGLPPGQYRLAFTIGVDDSPIVKQQEVQMLPPGAGMMQIASALPYPDATGEQLDSLFGPMRLIAAQNEQQTFDALTSAEAKRRFIARFWEQRAVAAGMTYEEILQDWQARVDFVNRQFLPVRAGEDIRAGWQTDRGRIYLKYGPPNERYTSGQTDDISIKACEAWQYSGGRGDRYVFWDRAGFGDFELVFSTDRDEPGIPEAANLYSRSGRLFCEPGGIE